MAARESSRARAASAFLAPASLMVCLMMLAPLLLLARFSVNRFDQTALMIEAFTPQNYLRFFTDPFYVEVMRTTIVVSIGSTVLCLLLGLPLAYRLARMASR